MGTSTRALLGASLRGWRADLGASTALDTAPFVGGYGMRGGVVLDDGTVVLPLCDVPDYRRVFVVRSEDGGTTWSAAIGVASLPGRWFEEPAPVPAAIGPHPAAPARKSQPHAVAKLDPTMAG